MSNDDILTRIFGVTRHFMHPAERPDQAARGRGWVDAWGRPTEDGRDLIDAMQDQESTRGVYRLLG
ncbi:hypothetical protein Ga0609869_002610 [Rhodovulum iodosum]|uniref:Uncharacterized protein n=1 Tax=Rhodovulum iodosum TaxID=68291 RepID=A0ABV3XV93_9RHOB|nr:hypothetical protein [Rhodovulum robiginosum]RSK33559.1 hypothetical protein EJA01_09735 [Rhodovulum robiginosum]